MGRKVNQVVLILMRLSIWDQDLSILCGFLKEIKIGSSFLM